MSEVNITYDVSCKIENENERIKFGELALNENRRKMATIIAGEVVNEILGNALDIATRANETGLHWKIIKEESNSNTSEYDTIMLDEKGEEITSKMEPNLCDKFNIIDVRNPDLNKSKSRSAKCEMKNLLSGMIGSHYDNTVNYEAVLAKGGVGDQPLKITEQIKCDINDEKIRGNRPPIVNKKSPVFDVTYNTNEILNDNKYNKLLHDEWEESEEQLIQTVDLEHETFAEGDNLKQRPENIPLPDDDNDSGLLDIPEDNTMDMIDLNSKSSREEENKESADGAYHTGGKGDEYVNYDVITVVPHHETPYNIEGVSVMQVQNVTSKTNTKEIKIKKKKWNVGTKIMNFLRRYSKPGN